MGTLAAFLTVFYDTLAEQKENYIQLMSSYPREMWAFFATSDAAQMFTPAGFLNLEFYSYMPLIIGIFAILGGSGLLAGDEENGTLDLILGHPVGRTALFLARLLAFLAATAAILAVTWLGFAAAVPGTKMDVGLWELVLPMVSLLGILILFGTLALLLSMLLPSRRMAAMASGIALVACYFINALAQIDDVLEPLAKILPFRYYQGGLAIEEMNWGEWGVMLGISALFIIVAWWRFERRDIRVGGEGGWGLPAFVFGKRKAAAED